MKKRKLYEFSKKYISTENIRIAILFLPLIMIIINEIKEGSFVFKDFTDTTILISFMIVFLCESIAVGITDWVEKISEDAVKLDTDYRSLITRYQVDQSNMISFGNEKKIIIPAIPLVQRKIDINNAYNDSFVFKIELDEKNPKYSLPKQIADNSSQIFKAHSHSVIYNNINVRLNDLLVCNNELKLVYSFTTYFDSLLTNRAMDYRFKSERTIREIYEPGPYISDLSKSKFSNHLGFNGFVELSDGNIIFLKRGKSLSVAKGMWQQSIGASLKTKYCVGQDHKLSVRGIAEAIRMEIKDELKIELNDTVPFENYIFAFYRDLVEGGKPQFLFYYKTLLYDKDSFVKNFNGVMKKKQEKKQNSKKQEIDGREFAFFTIDELRTCTFTEQSMIHDCNEYKMMPSSIASIIMLLNNII